MAGYTRQSTFDDGDTVFADDHNNEYNKLVTAFNQQTGHKHDGTSAEGPVLALIGDGGDETPLNKVVVDTANNRVGFFINVSSAAVEQIRVQDGAVVPVITNDVDLGTSSLKFKDVYIAGTLTADTLTASTINLTGYVIGTDVQAFDQQLDDIAAITPSDGVFLVGNDTTFVGESGATARSSLGLGSIAILSSVNNDNWSGTDLSVANGGTGASDESTARDNLGLGGLAIADTINNDDWSGADLSVINGGTGASDAGTARLNLGLGSAAVQDYSEDVEFTPTFTDGTNSPTYILQVGRYTSVGNLVHFRARVSINNLGSVSGDVRIGGLPFPAKTDPTLGVFNVFPVYIQQGFTTFTAVGLQTDGNNYIDLKFIDSIDGNSALQASDVGNGATLTISGTYEAEQ